MDNSDKTPQYITSKQLTLKDKSTDTNIISTKITSSFDAEKVFREFIDPKIMEIHEEFHVLYLNRGNKVIGHAKISQGGVSGTVADGKIIFSIGLQMAGISGILLCHNHPSGQTTPSEADKTLTAQLKKFGAMIDIVVLDHIILTEASYLSFADSGLI